MNDTIFKIASRRQFIASLTTATFVAGLPHFALSDDISIKDAIAPRFLGKSDAPVHVAEYYSMTCSHCAAFHNNIFPTVKSKLIDTGILRFEMRPFPLDGLALRAHALVRGISQKKFFPLVKVLLAQHPVWLRAEDPLAALMKLARLAGVSAEEFNAIMRNRELLEAIVAVKQEGADEWQITSTPSFVVNENEVLSGNMNYEDFAERLSAFGA